MNVITIYPNYKFSALPTNNLFPLKRERRKLIYSNQKIYTPKKSVLNIIDTRNTQISEILQNHRKLSHQSYRQKQSRIRFHQSLSHKKNYRTSIIHSPPKSRKNSDNIFQDHQTSIKNLKDCLTKKKIHRSIMPKGMQRFFISSNSQKQQNGKKQNKQRKQFYHTLRYCDIPPQEFLNKSDSYISEAQVEEQQQNYKNSQLNFTNSSVFISQLKKKCHKKNIKSNQHSLAEHIKLKKLEIEGRWEIQNDYDEQNFQF